MVTSTPVGFLCQDLLTVDGLELVCITPVAYDFTIWKRMAQEVVIRLNKNSAFKCGTSGL